MLVACLDIFLDCEQNDIIKSYQVLRRGRGVLVATSKIAACALCDLIGEAAKRTKVKVLCKYLYSKRSVFS